MTFQSSNITRTRQGENPLSNQTRSLLLLPNQTLLFPFSTRQITVCTPENRKPFIPDMARSCGQDLKNCRDPDYSPIGAKFPPAAVYTLLNTIFKKIENFPYNFSTSA
jgi:hypothetical protein